MATLRGLVRTGQEITRLGQERPGEVTDLVDRAEQMVFELGQQRVTSDFSHIEALLKESFERISQLVEVGAEVTGVPSGYRELDLMTSGFQPGNLVILAARPSMGKSALGLCVAANLGVRHSVPVALFTLEMSKAEVTQRMMCSEGKVESQRLRTGRLAPEDWPRLTTACDRLMKAPIWVDDTGSTTMMELRSKARRLKSREPNLGLIVVDYLQLMTSGASAENRVQEVSQISRALKVLARDLEVPILAMSQLSRAVEQRQDKRPLLSDLREAGASSRTRTSSSSSTATSTTWARSRSSRASPRSSSRSTERADRDGQALVPAAVREICRSGCGIARCHGFADLERPSCCRGRPRSTSTSSRSGAPFPAPAPARPVEALREHAVVRRSAQIGTANTRTRTRSATIRPNRRWLAISTSTRSSAYSRAACHGGVRLVPVL